MMPPVQVANHFFVSHLHPEWNRSLLFAIVESTGHTEVGFLFRGFDAKVSLANVKGKTGIERGINISTKRGPRVLCGSRGCSNTPETLKRWDMDMLPNFTRVKKGPWMVKRGESRLELGFGSIS